MNRQNTVEADRPRQPGDGPAQFDFRSARFAREALALQRLTGRSLLLCRQELFIAEGDALEAWQCLVQLAGPGPPANRMH